MDLPASKIVSVPGIRFLLLASVLVGALAGLLACPRTDGQGSSTVPVPYYNTPDFTPVWLVDSADLDKTIPHRVGDFSLRNQFNQQITQATLAEKVHVANFFFTSCPSICPKITSLLRAVQDTFRREPKVILLSFSVTPWLDSLPRLRGYAKRNGVLSKNWHLLTGGRGAIYALARQSYFAEEAMGFSKDSTEFLHTEHVVLVDKNRRIRGIYNGTQALEIDKLIIDIHRLLKEN